MSYSHYAVRHLNPFGGVAQVVSTGAARAISLDGARWEIQVLAEAPNDCWGSLNANVHSMRFFRFGIWSAESGLRRIPVNPIMDFGAMIADAEPLLDAVRAAASRLPFPLTDSIELWLFDRHCKPLALLMSAMPGEDRTGLHPRRWCAAPLHDRNLGTPRPPDRSPVADDLEALVRRSASPGTSRWLRREVPGEGNGVTLDDDSGEPLSIPAADFPALPLRLHWENASEQVCVDRWVAWAAPRLLCLPYLPDQVKHRLECDARQNPTMVDTLWRIYPESVDEALIRAARVEVRLRRAEQTAH